MYATSKIAILLATYNGEKYIEKQLNSILAQESTDWTVYIHDDGSKDNTLALVHKYTALYPQLFKLVEGPGTGGAKSNFFYLMKQVEAPYYMFCDQDDVWMKDKVGKTLAKMKKMEAKEKIDGQVPTLVFTELKVVSEELKLLADSMSQYQGLDCSATSVNRMMIQNVVTGCTMMVNKCLRDLMISYKHEERIIMHDWWAGLLAAEFGQIAFIEEPTILYRQHTENSVGAVEITDKDVIAKKAKKDKIQESLQKTRMQVLEMVECFGMEESSLAYKYARSGEWTKLRRMIFYFSNDIKKGDSVRNVGLLLFG